MIKAVADSIFTIRSKYRLHNTTSQVADGEVLEIIERHVPFLGNSYTARVSYTDELRHRDLTITAQITDLKHLPLEEDSYIAHRVDKIVTIYKASVNHEHIHCKVHYGLSEHIYIEV